MKTFTIHLDVSHEATVEHVAQFAHQHDCYIRSVELNGPAGGNPCYEFGAFNFSALRTLAEDILGRTMDEEEIKTRIVEH